MARILFINFPPITQTFLNDDITIFFIEIMILHACAVVTNWLTQYFSVFCFRLKKSSIGKPHFAVITHLFSFDVFVRLFVNFLCIFFSFCNCLDLLLNVDLNLKSHSVKYRCTHCIYSLWEHLLFEMKFYSMARSCSYVILNFDYSYLLSYWTYSFTPLKLCKNSFFKLNWIPEIIEG